MAATKAGYPRTVPEAPSIRFGTESHNLAPPANYPEQPVSQSEETNGDNRQIDNAMTVFEEGKNPNPLFNPAPTITAGIPGASSNQNTDPASHDNPPLVRNADPVNLESTNIYSQAQPGDPHQISTSAETLDNTGSNDSSEVHPLPGIIADSKNNILSESSPGDETGGDLSNENPKKFDQTAETIEDLEIDNSSSNKVPGISNPADEMKDKFGNESLGSTEPSTKGMQSPGTANANESDTGHGAMENPGNEDPSRPRPSDEFIKGNGEEKTSNPDAIGSGTGNDVLNELNFIEQQWGFQGRAHVFGDMINR